MTKLVLAVSCCFLVGTAGAQITITAGDIPQVIGDSFHNRYLNGSVTTVDNGSAGGPHTWTFDTASYPGVVYTTTIVDRATTPFAGQFPDANRATREPRGGGVTLFEYSRIDAGQVLVYGFGNDDNGILKAYIYAPPTTDIRLPATYGNSWQTGYSIRDTFLDTVYAIAFARRCSVDAWGTAVTPAGSYECLRENWVEVLTETAYVAGIPVYADTLPDRQYVWMAKGQGMVAMTGSLYGDSSLNFTQASQYTVMVHASVSGVADSPGVVVRTPVRGATIMSRLPAGAVAFDAMGRKVVNPRPGVAFIREPSAAGRGPSAVTKVVIQH